MTTMLRSGEPHFSREEFERRLEALQHRMRAEALDALLVHTPENVYYLSGHHTQGYYMYQCMVVPPEGAPLLLLRHGELGNALTYGWLDALRTYDDTDDPIEVTAAVLREWGLTSGTIGVEMGSWFVPQRVFNALHGQVQEARFVDATHMVGDLRTVKSSDEVALIRRSADIASEAMRVGIEATKAGVEDRAIAAEVMDSLMRGGSEYLAMEPFVAVGPRAGTMHSTWDGRVVRDGDTVLLEIAAASGRYHAALMRTVAVGAVDPEFVRWSEVTVEALDAAIDAIKPGVTSADVDRACRGVYERAGLADVFRKRTGYAMGIAFAPDWGEGHIFALKPGDERELRPGMVFHMPPAVRRYGAGGVGFSETVLVTESGCEILTSSPRRLVHVA